MLCKREPRVLGDCIRQPFSPGWRVWGLQESRRMSHLDQILGRASWAQREGLQEGRAQHFLGTSSPTCCSFRSRVTDGARDRSWMSQEKHTEADHMGPVRHAKKFKLVPQAKSNCLQNHSQPLFYDGSMGKRIEIQ